MTYVLHYTIYTAPHYSALQYYTTLVCRYYSAERYSALHFSGLFYSAFLLLCFVLHSMYSRYRYGILLCSALWHDCSVSSPYAGAGADIQLDGDEAHGRDDLVVVGGHHLARLLGR